MGVASGCGEQEAGVASGSGWNLWVWLVGVVVRRYIDFIILLIPTPLVSVLFCSSKTIGKSTSVLIYIYNRLLKLTIKKIPKNIETLTINLVSVASQMYLWSVSSPYYTVVLYIHRLNCC